MARSLSDLRSAAAVQAALDEFLRLGQQGFLRKYGFGRASNYLAREEHNRSLGQAGEEFAVRFEQLTLRTGGCCRESLPTGCDDLSCQFWLIPVGQALGAARVPVLVELPDCSVLELPWRS